MCIFVNQHIVMKAENKKQKKQPLTWEQKAMSNKSLRGEFGYLEAIKDFKEALVDHLNNDTTHSWNAADLQYVVNVINLVKPKK